MLAVNTKNAYTLTNHIGVSQKIWGHKYTYHSLTLGVQGATRGLREGSKRSRVSLREFFCFYRINFLPSSRFLCVFAYMQTKMHQVQPSPPVWPHVGSHQHWIRPERNLVSLGSHRFSFVLKNLPSVRLWIPRLLSPQTQGFDSCLRLFIFLFFYLQNPSFPGSSTKTHYSSLMRSATFFFSNTHHPIFLTRKITLVIRNLI